MSLVGKPFWAALPKEESGYVEEVKLRVKRYFEAAEQLGLIEEWRKGEAAYFLKDRTTAGAFATALDLGTKTDPRVTIKVPELRSLLRQELAFITSEPGSFQVVPNQGDTRSVMTGQVAERGVNYIYEEHAREPVIDLAEFALYMGLGGTHMRWDATRGEDVRVEREQQDRAGNLIMNPQTGKPATVAAMEKTGAPFIDALTPFEQAWDPKIGIRAGYAMAFEETNLYALAGEFAHDPALVELILNLSTQDEFQQYRLRQWQNPLGGNEGDVIAVHFYYADRPELRNGRYSLIVGDKVIFDVPKCPLANGRLPVRPLVPSKYADNAWGFAEAQGLLGIEDATNRIRSASLTNIAYFGNQSRYREEGTTVVVEQLSSGQNMREYVVPRDAKPPGALPIAPMPAATPAVMEDLIGALPRISGFGNVSRGQIEKTTSGVHAAQFEAITARNQSLLQGKVARHEEELANDLIEMIMRYANTAFVVEMAGNDGSTIARSFAPDDFKSIRRVRAKKVPEAMRGPLARLELLERTKDYKDNPRQQAAAIEMVVTGSDEFMKVETRSINRVAWENEMLVTGKAPVHYSDSQNHYVDIVEHNASLDQLLTQPNPDPMAVKRHTDHIQEHIDGLMNQDPVIAQACGYPPPPILPGNPAFVFAQMLKEAQDILNPQPLLPEEGGAPNDQQPPAAADKAVA